MTAAKARQTESQRSGFEARRLDPVRPEHAERELAKGAPLAARRATDLCPATVAQPTLNFLNQLHHAFDDGPLEERWSHRRTAAFLLVTCGSFWIGLALTAQMLL